MTTAYLQKILTARVYDVAIESPLELAPTLSQRIGNKLYLKREDMQSVFSYKIRGSYNKMAHLTPAQLKRGVICASAGNHAQGVALSAAKLGCRAVIVMPTTTPQVKIDAVKALLDFIETVMERIDQRLTALGIFQQVVLKIGIATHDPDVAQHFVQHARGTPRLARGTQFVKQAPCLIAQQPHHDFAVRKRGVVVGNFTYARGNRAGGHVGEQSLDLCGGVHQKSSD